MARPANSPDGTEKRIGGEITAHAHGAFCPSIYARDSFEKLFRWAG